MSMPDLAKRWTREEVLELPDDGKRYELLDGELLVTPSPAFVHQRAVMALYDRVSRYVNEHRVGWACQSPADLDLRTGQLLQPDLFVVPAWQSQPQAWSEVGIPLLVAEVLSPSTAPNDRKLKRRRYQRSGVGEYWIVDTDARLIERWRPNDERPEILLEQIEWQPKPELPPLLLDLTDYFKEVWGE